MSTTALTPSPDVTFGGRNWMRVATLVVSKGTNALDLSNLRIRFEVRAADVESPNTLFCRVYNPALDTLNKVIKEFDTVTLQAGYQDAQQGIIFQGDIKQFRFGRERNVDNYLDIMAGDGDAAYNESVINKAFPAGTSDLQQLTAIAAAMGVSSASTNDGLLTTGGVFPRGKTLFGMARAYVREIAEKNNCRWSIQNGQIVLVPNTGYLPGQAIVLNSASGMIGTPEQTDNGIMVRCYLNPLIKVGQAVQINNRDINQAASTSPGGLFLGFPSFTSQYYPAKVSDDGLYRVIVAEHVGDTRGNEWATELTCLDIDPSAKSPQQSVLASG